MDWNQGEVLPVTVVIPTWRRPEWLRRCLRAVLAQEPPAKQVIVVGRDEDKPTRDVLRDFEDKVSWVTVERPGHVAPIRTALDTVDTPLLAMIDDDAEPMSHSWLLELVKVLSRPNVACVGSQVRNVGLWPRKVKRSSGRILWYGRVVGNVAGRMDPTPVEVAAPQEANWAWRTEVLAECAIDPIWDDGDAVMYSLDLCLQAKRRGWAVLFTSSAPVIHHLAPRDNSLRRDDSAVRTFAAARNLTYVALKHYGWRLVPFAVWSTFIGDRTVFGLASAVAEMVRHRATARDIAASVRGRWAGIRSWRTHRKSGLDRQPRPRSGTKHLR